MRRLLLIARKTTYNGFPVVWDKSLDVKASFDSGRGSDKSADSGTGGNPSKPQTFVASEIVVIELRSLKLHSEKIS